MAGDQTSEGSHQVAEQRARWLAGEGRETVRDVQPVLAAIRDQLGQLIKTSIIRDDPVCMLLVDHMVLAPDMAVFHSRVEQLEERVKDLLAARDKARRVAVPNQADKGWSHAPVRRLLKL
ncbi:hypothetical protein [Rhizobium oryzicola]|uniref:Uncharacterized protein n=1 Tax=Rhizobium oryzicola TaxID=1232668 RepID=A0ABT8SZV2_9HYPH|nr:hypothetical protein [Rhizobium oryzicola]MDO1583177.1 hypothetical protein [Rhizobium oryzicola]